MHHKSTGVKPALNGATQPSSGSSDHALTAAVTRVRQLLANAKHKAALEQAKEVHKTYRCAASETLLIDAYVERIQDLILKDLVSARDEATPPEFKEMVERYYEVLSGGGAAR